jgi:hypothetical protein
LVTDSPQWPGTVAAVDFDSDGDPAYVLYNVGTRQTAIWYLNNNLYASSAWGPTLPVGWSLVAPRATVDVNPDVVFATTIAALKEFQSHGYDRIFATDGPWISPEVCVFWQHSSDQSFSIVVAQFTGS